jgi:adenylate kinase family enzyme
MKIWLFGAPGSGKTFVAKKIADHYNIPHYELDGFFWSAGWTKTPESIFLGHVREKASGSDWIFDGNYPSAAAILEAAQLAIWVDLPFFTTYPRVVRRSIGDTLSGKEIFSGNRETFRRIFSRNGMPVYSLLHHKRNHRRFKGFYEGFPNRKRRLRNPRTLLEDAMRLCDEVHSPSDMVLVQQA